MGTANSYTGSGGAWNRAGDDLIDWLDSLPDHPPSGDPPPDEPEPTAATGDNQSPWQGSSRRVTNPVPGLAPSLRNVTRALRSRRGQSDGEGGAGRGGGSGVSSSGRTGRAAGRVGGRAAAGIAALRAGDDAGLRALGLDPTELKSLGSTYAKARRIADAAAEGAPTSIQDEELRKAAAAIAIWGLQKDETPEPADLIRRFVEEYLYRVITVEFGSRMRNGAADGKASLPTEQVLRSTLRAMIRHLPVTDTGSGHIDLGRAIESTYDRILDIWEADE